MLLLLVTVAAALPTDAFAAYINHSISDANESIQNAAVQSYLAEIPNGVTAF